MHVGEADKVHLKW